MFNKFWTILFLYSALAILLGHNFIPHHHHLDHNGVSHHHSDGHQHDNTDSEDESDDWTHLFSGIQYRAEGLIFLTSNGSSDNLLKQIPQFTALHSSSFIFQHEIIEARQNAPPYIIDDHNSQIFIPYGLRAPPISFV